MKVIFLIAVIQGVISTIHGQCSSKSKKINEGKDAIQSRNYPNKYSSQQNCKWQFQLAANKILKLTVEDIKLWYTNPSEPDGKACPQTLRIGTYDVPCNSSPPFCRAYHHKNCKKPQISGDSCSLHDHSETVDVVFTSTGAHDTSYPKGFQMNYEITDCTEDATTKPQATPTLATTSTTPPTTTSTTLHPTTTESTTSVPAQCSSQSTAITDESGTIKFPNHPDGSNTQENCTWSFQLAENKMLKLNVTSIQLWHDTVSQSDEWVKECPQTLRIGTYNVPCNLGKKNAPFCRAYYHKDCRQSQISATSCALEQVPRAVDVIFTSTGGYLPGYYPKGFSMAYETTDCLEGTTTTTRTALTPSITATPLTTLLMTTKKNPTQTRTNKKSTAGTTSKQDDGENSQSTIIIPIAVSITAVFLLVILVLAVIWWKKRQKPAAANGPDEQVTDAVIYSTVTKSNQGDKTTTHYGANATSSAKESTSSRRVMVDNELYGMTPGSEAETSRDVQATEAVIYSAVTKPESGEKTTTRYDTKASTSVEENTSSTKEMVDNQLYRMT